jgi:hypothetical protein
MAHVKPGVKWEYKHHRRTPNSSVSPVMLARNSSSSVGTGVSGSADPDPDSGSRASELASMRVKEECDDPAEPRDRHTTSELQTEQSNEDSPKEDGTSEDSIGLVTTSLSVIRGGLLEPLPFMVPMAYCISIKEQT